MAVSSVTLSVSAVRSPRTGLRPEPQGVRTLAAGAALEPGAEARRRGGSGKGVFDRHSTQSSIAARLRRDRKRFRALRVDRTVYTDAKPVYKSAVANTQVAEYRLCTPYTASLRTGVPRG